MSCNHEDDEKNVQMIDGA